MPIGFKLNKEALFTGLLYLYSTCRLCPAPPTPAITSMPPVIQITASLTLPLPNKIYQRLKVQRNGEMIADVALEDG
ncbi:hypothetical protein [Psychromonas aquimarina]|uniref:hypothetical protein n=1 Tax=Psychromonas aquimarina TaxID=444919 RepID=UPI00040649FF|nr:hypothetical protein [Psychromonas aquimarina]